MSGLNALLWVCAVGLAVLFATYIVELIKVFRNRIDIERSAHHQMTLLCLKLRQDVDKLIQDVDELKKKQQCR